METANRKLKLAARHLTLFGVLSLALGLAAIWAPFVAGVSVVVTVGVLVVAAGILRMVWAFGTPTFGKGVSMFALGGLTLLCGLSLVTYPWFAFGFLTALIAFYLFTDGVAEIMAAFRPQQSGRAWLLFGGVASIILGTIMWAQFPLSGGLALGVLLGMKLIFIGGSMLASGSAARTLAKGGGSPLSPAV